MTGLILFAGVLTGCFLSVLVGLIGSRRNIGFTWAFIISLILTPFIGLLFTLLSKERANEKGNKYGCIGSIFGILGLIFLIMFIVLILATSCEEQRETYSNPTLWYSDFNQGGDKDFDVFYILPTCVWDKVDSNGHINHYADPLLDCDREAMRPSFELSQEIFGDEANFYSPYYHQLALESWSSDSLVDSRFPRSYSDIKQAFKYYLDKINNGRPFVLAGFSQGGKCVVELLKTLSNQEYSRLVAAYVIGYNISPSDTLNYKSIKPAKGERDVGVTICYNSVASTDAVIPLFVPNAACINPINWTTSTTPASLNDTVTISIDKRYNVLIVDGFDLDNYYVGSLDFLFKKGNYHLQELFFYKEELSDNVKKRFDSFISHKELPMQE